jgi:holo-[acyl-carrier protein] synthase
MKKANPYPSLAVRYAAKEAVRKLDEIFVSGIHFHDVEVMVEDRGKPFILLHGKALEKATGAGIRDLTVSLSHSNAQAVAVVCANRG